MWVAVDDTDSPRGGCTTWVLTELARVAREHDLDLIGEPRLVRLNPNVPWKTRGNAALTMRVGHGTGPPVVVGEVAGRPVLAFPHGRDPGSEEARAFLEDAWRAVLASARPERGTDPALIAVGRRLPPTLYWTTVRERTLLRSVIPALRRAHAWVRVRSGRRGLIGAAAALAWPGRRVTWELIAYREPSRIGTPREVDGPSVVRAQQRVPELFLCYDPSTRRLLVAPHTRCPILFGLRATSRTAPGTAFRLVRSEPVERWMLFRTNQGSGDHLLPRSIPDLTGYRSGVVQGTVVGRIDVRRGGHVRFRLQGRRGERLTCLAFEPTKTLPAVARALVEGDRLRVWGSRGRSGALRLEGIEVVRLATPGRWSPPRCRECRRRARSLGTARGWRCDRCHRRFPPEAARWVRDRRSLSPGRYDATPSARRHLAVRAPEPARAPPPF